MTNSRIKILMKDLGYTNWEIAAYFILIKYGPKTALELSKLSKIARSKTYEVITRLRKKGLVMKIPPIPKKGITQKFVAIEPNKIFKSKINDIQELSQLLEETYKNPIQAAYPKINMYSSKNSVKALIQDITNKSKYCSIYLTDLNLKNILDFSFDNIIKKLNKKSYFILRNTSELKEFSKKLKNYSLINSKEGMSYIITDDKVIIDLFKSQYVVIEIISKEATNTFMDLFNNRLKKHFHPK